MKIETPAIIRSKKFFAAVIAAVISSLAVSQDIPLEQIALMTGPFYAYIGGQALADFGKEGASIKALFDKTPDNVSATTVVVRSGATANFATGAEASLSGNSKQD